MGSGSQSANAGDDAGRREIDSRVIRHLGQNDLALRWTRKVCLGASLQRHAEHAGAEIDPDVVLLLEVRVPEKVGEIKMVAPAFAVAHETAAFEDSAACLMVAKGDDAPCPSEVHRKSSLREGQDDGDPVGAYEWASVAVQDGSEEIAAEELKQGKIHPLHMLYPAPVVLTEALVQCWRT